MKRHHTRLDRIESAASPDHEPIHVYFRPPKGATLPPEAEGMEEPMQHSKTGEWEDAATREWIDNGSGVRVSLGEAVAPG